MRKYYLILPPTLLMKTEGFLTCSQMACAKVLESKTVYGQNRRLA